MSPSFTISAPPSTDIWRKPPSTSRFNAPTHNLLPSTVPLQSFHSARITLEADWTTRYDQGGLLLHLTNQAGLTDRWVKTGIEFYQDKVFLSTVATLTYSDWSITPPSSNSHTRNKTTIEVRREVDELGSSLWVYELIIGNDGEVVDRQPLREVTWFFAEEDGWEINVSAMAARPAELESVLGEEVLLVKFESAEVAVRT
ncbi:hypothetical protein D9757_009447 [Collybiopsis confluens]|uniref:Uncharacterized protein n=1 Tax=Collybiopsis confluens TaxID=2823264 RepID=A0A8H5CK57_9AGAR|nr:hypothetical protein D9757_015148 [Collybiopsis confluens]KAF5381178.1 hypothetical protein D9757_009447 [Collybiopsis confluens]